jgi:hypothetical protein
MPDWQKSRESFRDFLHQYPLWTAIDMFLDSRWGRRALQLGIGAVVMGASSVVAFIEHASPLIKYGLGGFSLALVVIGTFEFAQFQADKRKAESAPESSDEIPTLEAQSALYRFDERSCPYLAFAPDVENQKGDTILLVVYGSALLLCEQEVSLVDAWQSLKDSEARGVGFRLGATIIGRDINVEMDEYVSSHLANGLLVKTALSRGGAYRITDKGKHRANWLIKDMIARA